MDRICQYSTIIFAGNVSVLLLVAVTTDYWEYRGFRTDDLIPTLKKHYQRLRLVFPSDTSSYFVVKYFWDPPPVKLSVFATTPAPKREKIVANYTLMYYQPPALLVKRLEDYLEFDDVVYFDVEKNETAVRTSSTRKTRNLEDKLVLYIQYTNLFRECDILEAGVRVRLGLATLRRHRCFNFITHSRGGDFIGSELPAVAYLEHIGFTMSLVCIVVSVISLVSGAYGLLTHNRLYILTASSAACASGIAMTVCIAIFHGKGHLIHRHEFLAGVELPFKKTVEEHREHYYGWSFGLAWICVVLCFVHTWVWLVKAQDMPELCFPRVPRWCLFRRRRRRRRQKKPSPGRHHRVGDRPNRIPRHRRYSTGSPGIAQRVLIAPQGNGGLTISSTATTTFDDEHYAVIPDDEAETTHGSPQSRAAVSLASLVTAEHCAPCSRSLARTANGYVHGASSGLALATTNAASDEELTTSHVGNQCRGLSKSAGNFLFLSRRRLDTDEYRILNRPPDEFKVLLRPSETMKAFSADTLNFP